MTATSKHDTALDESVDSAAPGRGSAKPTAKVAAAGMAARSAGRERAGTDAAEPKAAAEPATDGEATAEPITVEPEPAAKAKSATTEPDAAEIDTADNEAAGPKAAAEPKTAADEPAIDGEVSAEFAFVEPEPAAEAAAAKGKSITAESATTEFEAAGPKAAAEPEAATDGEATAEPAFVEPEPAAKAATTEPATTDSATDADSDSAELSEVSDSVETGGPQGGRTARSPGQRLLNKRLAMLALAVAVALVAAGGVFAWLQINELKVRAAAPEEARQAAMRFATDLGTYDYRDPAGNFRLVAEQSTDNFAGQLKQITEAMTPLLAQTKATSKGSVAAAGVASVDGNRAVVVLFLDQTIENTNTKQPRVDRSRMRLTLVNEDDVWKLDHVEAR